MSSVTSTLIVSLILSLFPLGNSACIPRSFGFDSIVCVCNSTFCDFVPRNVPNRGQYTYYESNRNGLRMNQRTGNFQNNTHAINNTDTVTITLEPNERYQKMQGFGGAFTDSTGLNFLRMSQGSQNNIMRSYFATDGSRYTLGRVPIAGTDFSTRPYTYDDHPGDVGLTRFALTMDDYRYKMPLMKMARNLSPNLRFISASWSAPVWMKTNLNISGFGFLDTSYYQTYAEYLTRFLEEYNNAGLDIWAITTGNEPSAVDSTKNGFNSMGWTAQKMSTFVSKNLAPTIARSSSNNTVILIIDDQRYTLPWSVIDVYQNIEAYNATVGIAVHWYFDFAIVPEVLDVTNALYPERFILITEGCVGNKPFWTTPVELGDWARAEAYITDLIQNYNHWATGFIDWNLVLDRQGGPNWAKNFVDSPIIINPETDEFFKQPSYYALAHFSKFIPPGSIRIGAVPSCCVQNVAFLTPDNEIVVVIYNGAQHNQTVAVIDPEQGNILMDLSPRSIQTIIYRR